jgi:hypothetical protein
LNDWAKNGEKNVVESVHLIVGSPLILGWLEARLLLSPKMQKTSSLKQAHRPAPAYHAAEQQTQCLGEAPCQASPREKLRELRKLKSEANRNRKPRPNYSNTAWGWHLWNEWLSTAQEEWRRQAAVQTCDSSLDAEWLNLNSPTIRHLRKNIMTRENQRNKDTRLCW